MKFEKYIKPFVWVLIITICIGFWLAVAKMAIEWYANHGTF
jgi:hypothetical protein